MLIPLGIPFLPQKQWILLYLINKKEYEKGLRD